jgi:hypothetical protein
MIGSWFRLMAAGADMASTALRTGEAMAAADRVIRNRSVKIASAWNNPVTADYAELGRLIPEKVAATGRATSDVMTEWLAIWTGASRQWQGSGGVPADELMLRTMGLYAIALQPFHAAVTANDKRLRRKR